MGLALIDLGDQLTARVVASCREREPSVNAILVHGSYATNTARLDSDLDLALFVTDPSAPYRTWFEPRAGQAPLHVSARCDLTIDAWTEESDQPEDWSLGLPVRLEHQWLWCGDVKVSDAIGDEPRLEKPGGSPEIEDMVEAALKMRRHHQGGDNVGVRLQAQMAARFAAPTVAALNDPAPVSGPREAVEGIVSLPVTPSGWEADFLTAFGLIDATVDQVSEAANRLVTGTLRLVRELDAGVDKQPDIERYVRDGTLERMLA